jgi:hypothetical protein
MEGVQARDGEFACVNRQSGPTPALHPVLACATLDPVPGKRGAVSEGYVLVGSKGGAWGQKAGVLM